MAIGTIGVPFEEPVVEKPQVGVPYGFSVRNKQETTSSLVNVGKVKYLDWVHATFTGTSSVSSTTQTFSASWLLADKTTGTTNNAIRFSINDLAQNPSSNASIIYDQAISRANKAYFVPVREYRDAGTGNGSAYQYQSWVQAFPIGTSVGTAYQYGFKWNGDTNNYEVWFDTSNGRTGQPYCYAATYSSTPRGFVGETNGNVYAYTANGWVVRNIGNLGVVYVGQFKHGTNQGFAGTNNYIAYTTNGGDTWAAADISALSSFTFDNSSQAVYWYSTQKLIVTTSTGDILQSADAGQTWTYLFRRSTQQPAGSTFTQLGAIHARGDKIVALTDQNNVILVSVDGGTSWSAISCSGLSGVAWTLYAPLYIETNGTFTMMTNNTSYPWAISEDNGATWATVGVEYNSNTSQYNWRYTNRNGFEQKLEYGASYPTRHVYYNNSTVYQQYGAHSLQWYYQVQGGTYPGGGLFGRTPGAVVVFGNS